AAFSWIARLANGDEVLVVSAHLSFHPGAVAAKGVNCLFPQPDAFNSGPRLDLVFVFEPQETNIVGYDLVASPGEGGGQRRLASTGRDDKGDATVRNVDGRRMEGNDSTLMTQRSERDTEQIGTHLILVTGR